MTENGHVQALAKLVRYVPESGVPLLVEPLSPYTFRALSELADDAHPDPPAKDYELPFPESALPGDTKPARDNPEYVRLVRLAQSKRNSFIAERVALLAARPEGTTKSELIQRFAERRSEMAQLMPLPTDEWHATFICCICTGNRDLATIFEIAAGQAPLVESEVQGGIAFFRLATEAVPSRTGSVSTRSSTEAPGLNTTT